ncbi:MAG: hypothetical protein ABSF26_18405 [Thermoguttaceae bacterium]
MPSGTYLISDTLIVYRATMLAGDTDHPPTLVLRKNAPGFGDPAKSKPMIVTYCACNTDPADRQWAIRTNEVGGRFGHGERNRTGRRDARPGERGGRGAERVAVARAPIAGARDAQREGLRCGGRWQGR